MERKVSKKNDPDGPLPKWGEPESVEVAMKATPGQGKKAEVKEAKYSVDVEGLPRFYMDADSPAQVKVALRKLLKKASSIDSVERVNDAKIKQDLRQRLKGAETDKRYVDEKLDPRMGVGEYIKDFRKSDAPQFKGKSMKKKTKMALAAYLSARREKSLEEKATTYNMSGVSGKKHKVTLTKKGDSMKPKWHLNVNGKDHGEHDSQKKAIQHFQKTHKEERAWHKRDDEQKSKGKDHQTLNYTTRGGQKMKTAVHKDKAFGAVGHFRKMGHTDVHLEGWRSGGGGYRDPFKAARRDAKYKELSHEYEDEKKLARLKQMRKQKAQKSASQIEGYEGMSKDKEKHDTGGFRISNADAKAARDRLAAKRKQKAQKSASQNKSFGNVRSRMEEVELDEGAKHKKVAKDLQAYAKKHGGIDKDDFLMAAQLVGDGKMRDLKKFMRSMDTDPRDGVITILRKNGIKEEVMNEIEEGMVNAVSTAKKYAGNFTKAVKKIDKMKSKKQGGDFSDNPTVQKKLRKYNEDFNSFKQFVESSCGGSHKGKKKAVEEGIMSNIASKAKSAIDRARGNPPKPTEAELRAARVRAKTSSIFKQHSQTMAMKKKKAVKEGLSPAQKKHMDTDKDGDIDAMDMKNLRNKKKS